MEITIEPGLITADSHIFNTKPKAFRDQQASTRFFSIPIQQREYSWGIHTNRIDDLLEDLLLFKNSKESKSELDESKDQYFAGTILLENQNSDTLKVIDGQQRLTTIFLLNFANFLICRYKLSSISVDKTPYAYAIEQSKRWQNFVAAERRVFSVDFSDQLEDFVSEENGSISENSLEWETRLGVKQDEYWNSVTPRLRFLEENRADELLNVLESTKLVVDQDSVRIPVPLTPYSDLA